MLSPWTGPPHCKTLIPFFLNFRRILTWRPGPPFPDTRPVPAPPSFEPCSGIQETFARSGASFFESPPLCRSPLLPSQYSVPPKCNSSSAFLREDFFPPQLGLMDVLGPPVWALSSFTLLQPLARTAALPPGPPPSTVATFASVAYCVCGPLTWCWLASRAYFFP